MDASIGLVDHHPGGARCDPPANRILAGAGADARAVDSEAVSRLVMDWRSIGHLA